MFRCKRFTFLSSLWESILRNIHFLVIPRTRERKFSRAQFPHQRCGNWAAHSGSKFRTSRSDRDGWHLGQQWRMPDHQSSCQGPQKTRRRKHKYANNVNSPLKAHRSLCLLWMWVSGARCYCKYRHVVFIQFPFLPFFENM